MKNNIFENRAEILGFLSDYYLGNKGAFDTGMVASNFVLVVGPERFE